MGFTFIQAQQNLQSNIAYNITYELLKNPSLLNPLNPSTPRIREMIKHFEITGFAIQQSYEN
jgi:hypothetical protein